MICPHCLVGFRPEVKQIYLGVDEDGEWGILKINCTECKKMILTLIRGEDVSRAGGCNFKFIDKRILFYPKRINRPPVPSQVPKELAEDYKEACSVLNDSPKASAALSRRCLQHLLRKKAKVKPGNLVDEIQQVIDSGELPTYIVKDIDAIRNVGNFSAHPIKSKKTREIIEVEPGEAEWNLNVLESLFDFYYVKPAESEERRKALNKKLINAGKKPMKRKK
ncbi:hypothetical protein ES702_04059 [subsurface metagenome]